MRAFGICVARSFSGQKTESSADVQCFWSTFKPGTKTILCVSQLSVIASFYKEHVAIVLYPGVWGVLDDIDRHLEEVWLWGTWSLPDKQDWMYAAQIAVWGNGGEKKLKKWIGILEDKVSVSSFSIHLRSGDHYADTAFKYLCIIAWYFNNAALHSPYMLGTVNKLGVWSPRLVPQHKTYITTLVYFCQSFPSVGLIFMY